MKQFKLASSGKSLTDTSLVVVFKTPMVSTNTDEDD